MGGGFLHPSPTLSLTWPNGHGCTPSSVKSDRLRHSRSTRTSMVVRNQTFFIDMCHSPNTLKMSLIVHAFPNGHGYRPFPPKSDRLRHSRSIILITVMRSSPSNFPSAAFQFSTPSPSNFRPRRPPIHLFESGLSFRCPPIHLFESSSILNQIV